MAEKDFLIVLVLECVDKIAFISPLLLKASSYMGFSSSSKFYSSNRW